MQIAQRFFLAFFDRDFLEIGFREFFVKIDDEETGKLCEIV